MKSFIVLWTAILAACTLLSAQSGNVGIGTDQPEETLHVKGNVKSDSTILSDAIQVNHIQILSNPQAGYVLTSDSTGHGTWLPVNSSAGNGNTLDQAYDEGLNPGDGRVITADAGPIEINSPVTKQALKISGNSMIPLVSLTQIGSGAGLRINGFPGPGLEIEGSDFSTGIKITGGLDGEGIEIDASDSNNGIQINYNSFGTSGISVINSSPGGSTAQYPNIYSRNTSGPSLMGVISTIPLGPVTTEAAIFGLAYGTANQHDGVEGSGRFGVIGSSYKDSIHASGLRGIGAGGYDNASSLTLDNGAIRVTGSARPAGADTLTNLAWTAHVSTVVSCSTCSHNHTTGFHSGDITINNPLVSGGRSMIFLTVQNNTPVPYNGITAMVHSVNDGSFVIRLNYALTPEGTPVSTIPPPPPSVIVNYLIINN